MKRNVGTPPACRRTSLVAAASALAITSLAAHAIAQDPSPSWSAPQPAPQPPPAYPPNLQAGGLTPPTTTATAQPPPVGAPNQTEKDLDKAQKEDSKRGLEWFWLNVEGGFSYVDMRTFVVDDKDFTFGFVPTKALGGTVGAGLGVRFLFLTLGARGRVGLFDPWQLFTVGGEIGIHIPLGRVEPHFELGGGYAAVGNVSGLVKGSSDAISISGGYGRASLGVDVFVTPIFSVGVLGSADLLALVRPKLNDAQIQAIQDDPSVTAFQKSAATGFGTEGSSLGLAGGVTAVLGLHF